MTKPFIIAFVASIGLGYILVNPWVLLYYLIFLAVATTIVLFIVVSSLVKRTSEWKTALLCMAVGYTAALSSYIIQSYLSSRIVNKRDSVISALYVYRDKYGHFPQTTQEALNNIMVLRANYVLDTTSENFTLYTKDFYGMPWVFTSKDSTWGR
jgi:hypothetical protein